MTWHTSSILMTAVVLLPLVSGCQTDAEEVDCDALCTRLDAMGCALTVVEGSGGATGGSPGCVDVCHQSSREASGNGCTEAWARFTDCLMEASSLTCHGPSFEDIAGCDAERQAWDLCDGTECDVRDGLVASGTTSEGVSYSLVFGRPDCECQPGMESPALAGCGDEVCPTVCCCGGEVSARVCLGDRCASEQEACGLLTAAPYSLCAPSE